MKRVGVVALVQDCFSIFLSVVGVDLHNPALLAVGRPNDHAVAVVIGEAHPNLNRPRAAVGRALLPNRAAIVVLQPAVVGGCNQRQVVVGQLVLEVAAGIDPVAQEGVPIVNVLCGSRELELRGVARGRRGDRTAVSAKRLAELDRNQIPLGGSRNHCRCFVVHHHRQLGLGGDNLHAGHAANRGVNRPVVVERVAGQLQHRAGCPGDICAVLLPLILDERPDRRTALRRDGQTDCCVHRCREALRLAGDLDARTGGIDIRADVLAGDRLQLADADRLLVIDMTPRNHGAVASAAFLVNQFRVVAIPRDEWIERITLLVAALFKLVAPVQLLHDYFQVFLGLIRADVEFPGIVAGDEKAVIPAAIRQQPAADARAVVVALAVEGGLGVEGAQVQHFIHRVVLVFLILGQVLHKDAGDIREIFKLQVTPRKDKPMNLHRSVGGNRVAGLVLHAGNREAVHAAFGLFAGGQHHG